MGDLSSFLAGEDPPPQTGAGAAPQDQTGADGAAGTTQTTVDVGRVMVNDRYEIFTDRPLNDFGSITAMTFAATDRRDAAAELVGYVCQTGLPPRWDIMSSIRGLDTPSVVKVVDYGIAEWAPDKAKRPMIITRRPRGQPLARSVKQQRPPMDIDSIARQIISPVTQALGELKIRRTFHGLVNPTNIYLRASDGPTARAELGECVTAPVGFAQPLLFETIERGMTLPVARGNGFSQEDAYALGVTILFLTLGQVPIAQLDDRAILAAKMEHGSFNALVGDAKLPPQIADLVRGLLLDDPAARWSPTDIELWANSRRMTGKQAPPPARRASRPYTFDGQEHWTARTIGAAMVQEPFKAHQAIESGELVHWLRRSMEDEVAVEKVEEAGRSARTGRGGTVEDRRLARTLIALDPLAPIRYKGKAVMPYGIGNALADAIVRGGSAQELAEIISAQLPLFWVNMQHELRPEHAPMTSLLDNARSQLDKATLGGGLERCLYELNPSIHCLSPMVETYHALDLDTLLMALEEIATKPGRPAEPYDRHICAFVLSRHGRIKDNVFTSLAAAPDSQERGMACLSLMAELQREAKIKRLPGLAAWVVTLLDPILQQYSSASLRAKVRDHLTKVAQVGSLKRLIDVVTNNNIKKRDQAAFKLACRDYMVMDKVITHREAQLNDRDSISSGIGRQYAAMGGGLLSALMVIGIVLMNA